MSPIKELRIKINRLNRHYGNALAQGRRYDASFFAAQLSDALYALRIAENDKPRQQSAEYAAFNGK